MTDLIALNKLVASRDNVRKTGVADGIGELAASIAAHGQCHVRALPSSTSGAYSPR